MTPVADVAHTRADVSPTIAVTPSTVADIPRAWPREPVPSIHKSIRLATHTRPDQPIVLKTLSHGLRSWIETFLKRANELSDLRPGWDGPHSQPINQATLGKLLRILFDVDAHEISAPQLAPLTSGGVQAEWHFYEQSIEIGVTADGLIFAYATDEHGDYVVELEETWFIPKVELFALRQAILDYAERLKGRAAQG